MELTELTSLRKKQFFVINSLLIIMFTIFLVVISIFPVTLPQVQASIGMILLLQAIYVFLLRNSTKSFIPVLEKVAIYEKQKMGIEWKKSRKTNFITLFVLSGFMFLNAYLNRGFTDMVFQADIIFPVLIIVLVIVIMVNVFLFLHIRKVDRAASTPELQGYTRKSNFYWYYFRNSNWYLYISICYFLCHFNKFVLTR